MPYNRTIKLLIFLNRVTHFIHYSSNLSGGPTSNNINEVNKRIKLLNELIKPERYKPKLIRVGSKYDGGYALAKYHKNNVLISGGIGNNSDFEVDICNKISYAYLFDHTVRKLNLSINNYTFYRKKIIITKNDQYGVNLNDFIAKIDSNSLILKLDIEGHEWNVLSQFSTDNLIKFEQILIEFHNLLDIYDTKKFNLYIKVLTKLKNYYKIINVNVNNYGASSILFGEKISDVYEISFLRNDLYAKIAKTKMNMLTSKNNPLYPQVLLD